MGTQDEWSPGRNHPPKVSCCMARDWTRWGADPGCGLTERGFGRICLLASKEKKSPKCWGHQVQMISVAYLVDSLGTSSAGTEKQLLLLLQHLDRTRFRPALLCLRSSRWLENARLPCPVHVLHLDSVRSRRAFRVARSFRRLHQEHHFDVLHTFFADSNVVGPVLGRLSGVGVTVSSRRNMGYWQSPLDRILAWVLRVWTTHYLANSEAVRQHTIQTEGADPSNVSVIYNALDTVAIANSVDKMRIGSRQALNLSERDVLVISIANLRPVKNLGSLIEAAALISVHYPTVRFLVVGEGPARNHLEELIERRRLQDKVTLVGSTSNITQYLSAADIAVQCSLSESFSNALIEYMAAGLPIVASLVGGNGEAIAHEETGLLYSGHDGPELAAAISRLLEDKRLGIRMGRAARANAISRFSVDTCIGETQSLYERLVEGEEHC